jgi:adenine-specific DNA-methyltransferase
MSANLDKFKRLLNELFQLDQADLDFGIYRIMNAKRGEITRFLESELLPQVKEAFQHYRSADKTVLQEELDKTIESARTAGFDPELSPKVKELREKLAAAVDVTALENEVFSDLYNFFRRYYNEGDFLSLRRYKEGVYAIPYEGEEVKLHWANADQYYIKTTEYFRNYTFKLPSGKRVHFKLAEADTERDNNQSQAGNDRRFLLSETDPLLEQDGDLIIRFEYHPDVAGKNQKDLNDKAVERILHAPGFADWQAELAQLRPTEKNPRRSLLEKHLTDYTARNTFDYFIHKDLGGFLRRELDFFIKNEIMHLDDIEHESAPRVEQYLSKIKVIRGIAHKIIEFLAQIENFQKKLWLKKKFVVETNYCVTLDRVPEDLYPEIVANDAQREEWVRLFAIDEIKGNLHYPKYTIPLTIEFLKTNPFIILDTKHFGQDFKDRLLASLDDVERKCDGVLLHSENSHALRLLHYRYNIGFNCIYIDPPFNTAATQILYKNDYRHSSYLSLISERIQIAVPLMKNEAIICVAIDDFELPMLTLCLSAIFKEEEHLATVPIRSNPHGRAMAAGFSPNHEYALFFGKTGQSKVGRLPRDEKKQARYPESDENGNFAWMNFRATGANSRRVDRPKLFYPIYISKSGTIRVPSMIWSGTNAKWEPIDPIGTDESIVLPLDSQKYERVWNLGWERAQRETNNLVAKLVNSEWQVYRKYHANQEGALPGTWWDDAKYSATESGTRVVKDILGEREIFSYPKSIYLVEDCLRASNCAQESFVLDFFAGSGTTAHAVINLNREDGGNRKYMLVEMGDYFDAVLKPRIQKVIYSKDWKDGKPVSREGSSHMFKYIRLESYEDTLNNLEFRRTEAQKSLLEQSAPFKESYMLSYMLDVESRGSASLLNIDAFEDPFNYKLNIATGSVGETRPVTVDLVETFNYLLGLTVRHLDHIRGFRVVQGTNPQGEKVLVIWRNLKEQSNTDLEEFFRKQEYNPKDLEFDLIYVNGDNNLENLRRPDETWKVRLIEEEFHRLMFQVEDV